MNDPAIEELLSELQEAFDLGHYDQARSLADDVIDVIDEAQIAKEGPAK